MVLAIVCPALRAMLSDGGAYPTGSMTTPVASFG